MEPVRWGVMGVADHFRRRVWLPAARSPLVELRAIASRDPARATAAARELGIPVACGSYEELLADRRIEAVYIPLPNHLHLEWIRRAADAGKHVLCEKPLAMDAAQAEEAVEHARRKKVLLMEAFMYRFHPQWQRVRELIRSGEIGRVQAVHTFFSYHLTDPDNIRNRPEAGGGGLMDIGCYAVSASRFLLEAEPLRALSLSAHDPSFGTDILTSGLLDFGDARGVFTVGTQTFPFQVVIAAGSRGRITVQLPFNTHPDVPARVTVAAGLGERELSFPPVDQYGLELEAFSRAVRGEASAARPRRPPPISAAPGGAAARGSWPPPRRRTPWPT